MTAVTVAERSAELDISDSSERPRKRPVSVRLDRPAQAGCPRTPTPPGASVRSRGQWC